ncbi:hypothetical protein QYE76_000809 [Lolium multiflorum]|uniref:Transposase (putative) gypsy type domain-containing protein n=1 Tax=Lolium multiflorum TaxID=4521 RepID=A0AAD8VY02_LOLMU|nr:hypothetical protein QYE76_000809 [Lolium multiflorum]
MFFEFLSPASHRSETSSPAIPTTTETIPMSSSTPPPSSEPIMATPFSSAPPPLVPVHLEPRKDSGKNIEGPSANPEETAGAEQMEKKAYELQPHHITANSILAISNHVTLCEGHLWIAPDLPLFQYYFSVKKEKVLQTCTLATCGGVTFKLRSGRVYPHTDRHESARYWSGNFLYLKDIADPASPKLTEEGLSGKDLTLSWFTKRIQPLQHWDRLLFQYTGRDDIMRASKDNLSADALDRRLRVLIKVPRDLRIHVCNMDIHTNGSGTALEALEDSELGTLLRVPHAGNTDPEVASEAEVPEAPRPSKRKGGASSGLAAKRVREAPSIADTRKAEAEKKRLKLIDTSNRPNLTSTSFLGPPGKA